jgi:short subunit fatty acids transporter
MIVSVLIVFAVLVEVVVFVLTVIRKVIFPNRTEIVEISYNLCEPTQNGTVSNQNNKIFK